MTNFRIAFAYPWLLLLLIPAIALTLLPYFRLAKKYRNTRNRIVSIVLHALVMVLAIALLAGMTFKYEIPNRENELLILVDSSFSNEESQDDKDTMVADILDKCGQDYRVGVVKFGYDQVYAGKMSFNSREVYQQYLQSKDPDSSATDIASALEYATTLFTNKKTSKIVLISDGIQTDSDAMDVINEIAAEGIKVDTVYYANKAHTEVQIVNAITPDKNVDIGEKFRVQLVTKSNFGGGDQKVTVTMYEDDVEVNSLEVNLQEGDQTIDVMHQFSVPGLHELRFEISNGEDTLTENNGYCTYMYLQVFENVLIIEKNEGEGAQLEAMLKENNYKVTSFSIQQDFDQIPTSANDLCAYEQVVLVNIANSDMPVGFDVVLNEYVYDLGGGMLTVGGENDTNSMGELMPHAYNRDDMFGTLYQQMLPVQVVNYTPPTAVMVVIDSSGSMGSGPTSKLGKAKEGAYACLAALTSRDYYGVITFDDHANEQLSVTPVSQRKEIEEQIQQLGEESMGGTVFSHAIEDAGRALAAVDVEKRHIILVTDGEASDKGEYEVYIKQNLKAGITMSVVSIQSSEGTLAKMQEDAALGGGKCYDIQNVDKLADQMYKDLLSQAIAEIEYGKEFQPTIKDYTSVVAGIKQSEVPVLSGYYGTKLKEGADAPLMGKYVPIYASWKYGEGSVGSFMSDLSGNWSDKFMDSPVGETIICNIIESLFPSEDIVPQDIKITFNEDNYTTQMNVYTALADTDTVEVTVTPLSDDAQTFYQEKPIAVTMSDGYTNFTFDITHVGLYQIDVVKKDASGTILDTRTLYKTFSYSKEYDEFPDETITGEGFLTELADEGRGAAVDDVMDVFASFERTLKKEFDPRMLFAILAICFFLMDVAVRKFKFKWPHEIIRDIKAKRASK